MNNHNNLRMSNISTTSAGATASRVVNTILQHPNTKQVTYAPTCPEEGFVWSLQIIENKSGGGNQKLYQCKIYSCTSLKVPNQRSKPTLLFLESPKVYLVRLNASLAIKRTILLHTKDQT